MIRCERVSFKGSETIDMLVIFDSKKRFKFPELPVLFQKLMLFLLKNVGNNRVYLVIFPKHQLPIYSFTRI